LTNMCRHGVDGFSLIVKLPIEWFALAILYNISSLREQILLMSRIRVIRCICVIIIMFYWSFETMYSVQSVKCRLIPLSFMMQTTCACGLSSAPNSTVILWLLTYYCQLSPWIRDRKATIYYLCIQCPYLVRPLIQRGHRGCTWIAVGRLNEWSIGNVCH